jgi:glutathione peroxidase
MPIYELPINTLDGAAGKLAEHQGKVVLVVNVASRCGLTPQYAGLERLHERFADQGFAVLGFPCNQFAGQEPGSPVEIAEFCRTTYGARFPLFEKIDVNGANRHPVYQALTRHADAEGHDGDVRWNFEKFLVGRDGEVIARFAPPTDPESPELVAQIEKALAG